MTTPTPKHLPTTATGDPLAEGDTVTSPDLLGSGTYRIERFTDHGRMAQLRSVQHPDWPTTGVPVYHLQLVRADSSTGCRASREIPTMRYRVMTEQTISVPHFKVFEAATMEEAERLAEAEVEGMTLRQDLPGLGWVVGDASTDYEVKCDVTEALDTEGD